MSDEIDFKIEKTSTYPAWLRMYGGRKFIVVVLTLISATVLVAKDHIADGVYSAVIIAVVAAYVTANVAQKRIQETEK